MNANEPHSEEYFLRNRGLDPVDTRLLYRQTFGLEFQEKAAKILTGGQIEMPFMIREYWHNNVIHRLDEIYRERVAQDEKWGEQNHTPADWLVILTEEIGEVARAICEARHGKLCDLKDNLKQYRKELIQLAAVAVSMVECLDRQTKNCENGESEPPKSS